MTTTPAKPEPPESLDIEVRIADVGDSLLRGLGSLLESVNGGASGPQQLARELGVDKVLASRLLKTVRAQDPLAAAHLAPGPEPLRRVVKAAARRGAPAEIVRDARSAIDRFEDLVRTAAGDRSALDAMLSAWLPDVRAEFEMRRKQAAFRAISQLKGVCADVDFATVMLHPSEDDPSRLDVLWLFGVVGLHRLRAGANVAFATRRMSPDYKPRYPETLDGAPVEGLDGLRLDRFCTQPPPRLSVIQHGETVRYGLAGEDFGPHSAVDLVFAEVNRRELSRDTIDRGRKPYAFVEVNTPVKKLIFTVLLHEDVYPGIDPSLRIYDTSFEGVANPNDPSRDSDQWDVLERIEPLGVGLHRFRTSDVPRYREMLDTIFDRLGWNPDRFRGHRCRIEYPIHGSQATVYFQRPDLA